MQEIKLLSDRLSIEQYKQQIADMLLDFRPNYHAWLTREEAVEEVEDSLKAGKKRISIVALMDQDAVGWVAGYQTYPNAFELHPLVVRFDRQKTGIGRILVDAFEIAVTDAGALIVHLGTDDHTGATTLGGTDLFPNVLGHVREIRNLKGHPFEFYQKCGYEIIGVLPDANAKGQPDILMAKSIA